MAKRVIFYLSIFLIIFLAVFYLLQSSQSDIVFNILSPAERPSKEKIHLHLYDNEDIGLNQVLIRAYYYIAADGRDSVIDNWQKVFRGALARVSDFYQLQFAYNMDMDFKIYPQPLYSRHNADYFIDLIIQDYNKELVEPHSESITVQEVVKEIKDIIKDEGEWDLSVKTKDSFYVVNLFILALDVSALKTENEKILGLNDESNNSLTFSAIFTDEEFRDFYESIIGHEVGHALGIPEFYMYSSGSTKSYGIMGGGFTRRLQDNYLEHQIKEKMGWY